VAGHGSMSRWTKVFHLRNFPQPQVD